MMVRPGRLLPVRSIRRRNGLVPFRQLPQASDGWQQVTFLWATSPLPILTLR